MNPLPVSRACELDEKSDQHQWLIDGLWADQAVGILGGEPKCCKSFLALDMAVSVASARPCLRQFAVRRTGPVLVYPAEDSLPVVRRRIEGICQAAGCDINALPLFVITAPRLLLDLPQDRQRLQATVAAIQPVLLVLDPFIRLHRADENASKDVAPLLGYLRELQRQFSVAVLLVHHVRKGSARDRPGQALRGSSDLHGWGDSNLYLRRAKDHLTLAVEHRAAASQSAIRLQLAAKDRALALAIDEASELHTPPDQELSPRQRVLDALTRAQNPLRSQQLRKLCRIRSATLCKTLADLQSNATVTHGPNGYSLATTQLPLPVSFPATP